MINQLILGDCLEEMKKIEDGSIDMVNTDPPYGTIAAAWDTIISFDLLWKEFRRIVKPDGAIIISGSQPFTTMLIGSNLKDFKYSWVWNKKFAGNFVTAKHQPMKTHEDICVFSTGKHRYFPQMTKRDKPIKGGGMSNTDVLGKTDFKALKKTYNEKYPISILDFPRELGRTVHPTQKPIALYEYLIKTYSDEGDLILDPFAGSFTTAVAAKNLNRNFICIEKEEKYYNIGLQRLGFDSK